MNPQDLATKQDISELKDLILHQNTLIRELAGTTADEVLSITQLEKIGCLGGYDRIKRLIRKGHLKTTPDGKITRSALNEYLSK